jgi:hypothetical protein
MLGQARDQFGSFVEWLDPVEDGQYRDQIINLYHGVEVEAARDAFFNHPWRDVVLDEEGLRAEALGAAALRAALSKPLDSTRQSPWYRVTGRAQKLYWRRQYETVVRILDATDLGQWYPHDQLLRVHARIMCHLAGEEGAEFIGEDTDYRRLRRALEEARSLLEAGGLALAAGDQEKIAARYRELEEVAGAVEAAGGVGGRFRNRLVDVLTGLASPEHKNPRVASALLLAKFEASRAMAGDASACQSALALPEQLYRTWAWWTLGLSDDHAPSSEDPSWEVVEREWGREGETLRRRGPKGEFASFQVFAFFALARLQSRGAGEELPSPEATFSALRSALSVHEQIRNGRAHSVYRSSRRERNAYFDLIDRWLTAALAVCPDPVSREELSDLNEPLPVVGAKGVVSWTGGGSQ